MLKDVYVLNLNDGVVEKHHDNTYKGDSENVPTIRDCLRIIHSHMENGAVHRLFKIIFDCDLIAYARKLGYSNSKILFNSNRDLLRYDIQKHLSNLLANCGASTYGYIYNCLIIIKELELGDDQLDILFEIRQIKKPLHRSTETIYDNYFTMSSIKDQLNTDILDLQLHHDLNPGRKIYISYVVKTMKTLSYLVNDYNPLSTKSLNDVIDEILEKKIENCVAVSCGKNIFPCGISVSVTHSKPQEYKVDIILEVQ